MGGFTVGELMEYLEQFPKEELIRTLIAAPKERVIYWPENVYVLTDAGVPVLCITVGMAEPMDENMTAICEKEERNDKGRTH